MHHHAEGPSSNIHLNLFVCTYLGIFRFADFADLAGGGGGAGLIGAMRPGLFEEMLPNRKND